VELKKLIGEDQPLKARRRGYRNLMNLYPYMGRYRDALTVVDKTVELSRQLQDSTEVVRGSVIKGLLRIWAWGDDKFVEEKPDSSLQSRYGSIHNWTERSLLKVYQGHYAAADSLAAHMFSQRRQFIHFLIQMKQDCATADLIDNDPSWRSGRNYFQVQMFYQLAQCHSAAGAFDRAMRAISTLRSKWETGYPRAIFYPKSIYLEGKVHEKKGDRANAIKCYEKLLALWKNADDDLPELIDTKTRLTMLKIKKQL